MNKFIILIILFSSVNSFAAPQFFYDDKPFNRRTAWNLTKTSAANDVFQKIYEAAEAGLCNLDYQFPPGNDARLKNQLKALGYEVTTGPSVNMSLITWCD